MPSFPSELGTWVLRGIFAETPDDAGGPRRGHLPKFRRCRASLASSVLGYCGEFPPKPPTMPMLPDEPIHPTKFRRCRASLTSSILGFCGEFPSQPQSRIFDRGRIFRRRTHQDLGRRGAYSARRFARSRGLNGRPFIRGNQRVSGLPNEFPGATSRRNTSRMGGD